MAEQTLNLPQIIVVLLLIYLGVRWYYSTPGGASPDSSDPASRSPAAVPRARLVQVERVAQMFPQLGRREILWDLHRNGGNVAATTERILAERGLEVVSRHVYDWGSPARWGWVLICYTAASAVIPPEPAGFNAV